MSINIGSEKRGFNVEKCVKGHIADFVRRSPPKEKPTCAKALVGEGGGRGTEFEPFWD